MKTWDKFLNGYFTGTRAPYGFKLVLDAPTESRERRYRLDVGDENEVDTVEFIFTQFAFSGVSRRKICSTLNANGVQPPVGNRNWEPRLISAILTDERYIGVSRHGKFRRVDSFPPVIAEWIFRAAQMRLGEEGEKRGRIALRWKAEAFARSQEGLPAN